MIKKDLSTLKEDKINVLKDYVLAINYFYGDNGFTENKQQAIFLLERNAKKGEVYSQMLLGVCYSEGIGINKDINKAIHWLEQVVKQKDNPDIGKMLDGVYFSMAKIYLQPDEKQTNIEKGISCLKESAKHGNIFAQFLLGERYRTGDGIEKNREQAIYWLSKAAEKGNSNAQYSLCLCHFFRNNENDRNFITNSTAGIKWCEKSAEQNNHNAQTFLGAFYYFTEPDYKKAFAYSQKNGNNSISQCILGLCYYYGNGVEKDVVQAVYWFELSAKQGIDIAQFFLVKIYYNGENDIEKDKEKAFYWMDEFERKNASVSDKNLKKSDIEQENDFNYSLEQKIEAIDKANTWQEDLMQAICKSGKTEVEVYKESHISKQLFSKIRSDKDYSPKKDTVIALAIGRKFSLQETEKNLADAGFAFSEKDKRDIIIKDFILRQDYDFKNINECLYKNNLPSIGNEHNED